MKINNYNIPQLFFVYGTLKKGFGNHRLLQHPSVEFLGEHVTEPNFTMLSVHGHFPAVVTVGDTPIKGELYLVKSNMIKEVLYNLEGFRGKGNPNNFYDTFDIRTKHGYAKMFVFKDKGDYPIIKTGEWV